MKISRAIVESALKEMENPGKLVDGYEPFHGAFESTWAVQVTNIPEAFEMISRLSFRLARQTDERFAVGVARSGQVDIREPGAVFVYFSGAELT